LTSRVVFGAAVGHTTRDLFIDSTILSEMLSTLRYALKCQSGQTVHHIPKMKLTAISSKRQKVSSDNLKIILKHSCNELFTNFNYQ